MQFHVTIEVADLQGARWERVAVLVDTGATYTKIPRELLTHLGITPTHHRDATVADGPTIPRDLAEARLRINNEHLANLVVFGGPGEEPLLGCITLESFSLGVDPINQRLIPVVARELSQGPPPK